MRVGPDAVLVPLQGRAGLVLPAQGRGKEVVMVEPSSSGFFCHGQSPHLLKDVSLQGQRQLGLGASSYVDIMIFFLCVWDQTLRESTEKSLSFYYFSNPP